MLEPIRSFYETPTLLNDFCAKRQHPDCFPLVSDIGLHIVKDVNCYFASKYDNRHQNTDAAALANLISKVTKMYISLLDEQQSNIEVESEECTYFVFTFLLSSFLLYMKI